MRAFPTDHGVPGSNPSGVPFVHLQMGDAKDRSPKKILSVIWTWKWEMRMSDHRLKGGAFDSLFCPEGRVFVHSDCPEKRGFAPFKSSPRVCRGGGGGGGKIDTCTSHRHRKSDMARPTSVDQVIHASLKCVEFFQLQSRYGSKQF